MTNAELIQAIRNEIERRITLASPYEGDYVDGQRSAYRILLSFLDTLESEKPLPNDLEEAAKEYALDTAEDSEQYSARYLGYKDGAKWQKEQNDKELSEKIAAAYQLGIAHQKEQMLKEAVEWTVTTNLANRPVIYLDELHGFKYGDKVHLVIIKEG